MPMAVRHWTPREARDGSSVEIRSVGQEAGSQRLNRWAQRNLSTNKVSEPRLLEHWSLGALGTVSDGSPLAAAGWTLERSPAHPHE